MSSPAQKHNWDPLQERRERSSIRCMPAGWPPPQPLSLHTPPHSHWRERFCSRQAPATVGAPAEAGQRGLPQMRGATREEGLGLWTILAEFCPDGLLLGSLH